MCGNPYNICIHFFGEIKDSLFYGIIIINVKFIVLKDPGLPRYFSSLSSVSSEVHKFICGINIDQVKFCIA